MQPSFTVTEVARGVHQISEPYHLLHPEWRVHTANSYVVTGAQVAAVVDTGTGQESILPFIRAVTDLPLVVVNTHSHDDHTGANAQLTAAGATILRHGTSATPGRVELGGRTLLPVRTPGHCLDHLAFVDTKSGILFTGDTLYRGDLFVCLADSNWPAYVESICELEGICSDMDPCLVCPGHNDVIRGATWVHAMAHGVRSIDAGHVVPGAPDDTIGGIPYPAHDSTVWLPLRTTE